MQTPDTSTPLRFVDLGASEGSAATLAGLGLAPEQLLACEVFYDPQVISRDQARESVRGLDADGRLPVSTIPASVSSMGGGPTRAQATAVSDGTPVSRDDGGQWSVAGAAFATRLVEAPDAGDIVDQSHAVLGRLSELLGSAGLVLDDVVKFNIYYRGEGTQEDWATAARVRASYFTEPGPATTGIPVPQFEDPSVLIAMQVLALRGVREQRRHSWPQDHWDWPFHLPYKHGNRAAGRAFIGGQVPLDGEARSLHVGDFPAQVRRSLQYVDRVLEDLQVPRGSVQRLTAYLAADASDAEEKLTALRSETAAFFGPGPDGPAVVPVPLPVLAYPGMDVEIEVQA